MSLTTGEIVLFLVAVASAATAAYQSVILREALLAQQTESLHDRQVDACVELLGSGEEFRSSLDQAGQSLEFWQQVERFQRGALAPSPHADEDFSSAPNTFSKDAFPGELELRSGLDRVNEAAATLRRAMGGAKVFASEATRAEIQRLGRLLEILQFQSRMLLFNGGLLVDTDKWGGKFPNVGSLDDRSPREAFDEVFGYFEGICRMTMLGQRRGLL